MHKSSAMRMGRFYLKHLKPNDRILEVGSKGEKKGADIYRTLPELLSIDKGIEYVGMDIVKGANVDLVVKDPYKWEEIESGSFDIVISGQAFEHIEFFWLVFQEMTRVLKPGGYMCVIVPKLQKTHRFPVDCWRFLPDGMRALARYTNIHCIQAEADFFSYDETPSQSYDCIGVFQK